MGSHTPRAVGWAVVNVDDGTVWARTTSKLGCFRRLASASDLPLTWKAVQQKLTQGAGVIEIPVAGDLYRFEVVPASDVEPI